MRSKEIFDKSGWLKGPWLAEPDYLAWIDSETNYACVARRNVMGAWCGYVGLDDGHPLFMVETPAEELKFIEVHGTMSYTAWNTTEDQEFYPARRLWWMGFDAMQDDDLCPAFTDETKPRRRRKKESTPTYRDLDYIKGQIESLAAQLAAFDYRFSL